MPPEIVEWEWDDDNLSYLSRRGLTRALVRQVWLQRPLYRKNLSGRAASHKMIGPDASGKLWTVCILEVRLGIWRAVNGWPLDPQDGDHIWYRRQI